MMSDTLELAKTHIAAPGATLAEAQAPASVRFLRSIWHAVEVGQCNTIRRNRTGAVAIPDPDVLTRIFTRGAPGALSLEPEPLAA